jgi:nicotinamidase/pyrazinamidase
MALKAHLVIIDPQNDFMDSPSATLPVAGANDDMRRVAKLIKRVGKKLADIHVTLDSHRVIDVGHPGFWRGEQGNRPDPFTIIVPDQIERGIWVPRDPSYRKRMLAYANALKVGGKYPLMVWPEHCKIGTSGHNVQSELAAALEEWERSEFATVDYVTKGTNPFTEHYGALMAEVPDSEDPSTMLNTAFLEVLREADIVGVAGEALSHCVKSTVDQIAEHIGAEHIKKFHILTDCSNPVGQAPGGPDFPAIAKTWLSQMQSQGMTLVSSDDFLR